MNKYFKEANYLHYSYCHEDFLTQKDIISENRGKALSILSGGDNSFSLLCFYDEVIALDLNPNQIKLGKLKAVGIKWLRYEEYLILLGIKKGDSWAIFESLEKYLDEETSQYFKNRDFLIKDHGLNFCGRFENYLRLFAKRILPLIHRKKTISRFLDCQTLEEQRNFYDKKFNNWAFKSLFKIFFSRRVMSLLGRDKEFFKYSKEDLSSFLKGRIDFGFHNVLNKENFEMQYILTNNFTKMPFYLDEKVFYEIKGKIGNLHFVNENITFLKKSDLVFDYMNLSDIFEYMDIDKTKEVEEIIKSRLAPSGRVTFYNMIVKRNFQTTNFIKLETKEFFTKERAFYYRDFLAYEVRK